tara:strand:+ start:4616 stop:4960 length:345 start_codon:yes stop_codon:yes gene_type:complete
MELNKTSPQQFQLPFPSMETPLPRVEKNKNKKVTFNIPYSPSQQNKETDYFSSINNIKKTNNIGYSRNKTRCWNVDKYNKDLEIILDPNASKLLQRRRKRQIERRENEIKKNKL